MTSTGDPERGSPRRLATAAAMNSTGAAPCRPWGVLVWSVKSFGGLTRRNPAFLNCAAAQWARPSTAHFAVT